MTDLHERKLLVEGRDYKLTDNLLVPISPEAQVTVDLVLGAQVIPFVGDFCSRLDNGSINFTDTSLLHHVGSILNQHSPFIGG